MQTFLGDLATFFESCMSYPPQFFAHFIKSLVALTLALALFFLLSSYLQFWWKWPSAGSIWSALSGSVDLANWGLALVQNGLALACLVAVGWWARHVHSLTQQANTLSEVSAYIVRVAFWAVVLIGLADTTISFLRVESWLPIVFGEWSNVLNQPSGRAIWVHFPLMLLAIVIATVRRTLGFIWLALLVVVAELQIVIARFIFSYEQAFMGDLVRFWYAALFIFASAYTLLHEGHVRVDVFYANWPAKRKAMFNLLGALLLGLPICWVILLIGFGSKTGVIVSPILSYEISQSGYGLYTKYLMAGFLVVFAVSMLLEFCASILRNASVLTEPTLTEPTESSDRPQPITDTDNSH